MQGGGARPVLTAGTTTASHFDRAKAERETKAKNDQKEAEDAYASFVASFGSSGQQEGPKFVKGGAPISAGTPPKPRPSPVQQPGGGIAAAFGDDDSSESAEDAELSRASFSQKPLKQSPAGSGASKASSADGPGDGKSGARRGMELLMADLRADVAEAGSAGPVYGGGTSTNMFLGFLAPTLDERGLTRLFAPHGPLLSVKVMWPRSDEERSKGYNTGFVAFAFREDAEAALLALDGAEVQGMQMTVGWARPLAPAAMRALMDAARDAGADLRPRAERLRTGGRTDSGEAPRSTVPLSALPTGQPAALPAGAEVVQVIAPADPLRRRTIDRLASFVAREGFAFERRVLAEEGSKGQHSAYAFLQQPESDEGRYYRWRVYACLAGEGWQAWRMHAFQMVPSGKWWRPPPCDASASDGGGDLPAYQSDDDEAAFLSRSRGPQQAQVSVASSGRQRAGHTPLEEADAALWKTELRRLEPTQRAVGGAMVWALQRASSAHFIVQELRRVVTLGLPPVDTAAWDATAAPPLPPSDAPGTSQRLACLYTVSDILLACNTTTTVPHTGLFVSEVQGALPAMFAACGHLLQAMTAHCGRISAQGMKERLTRMLRAWGSSGTLTPLFLKGLEAAIAWHPSAEQAEVLAKYRSGADEACSALGIDSSTITAQCRRAGCVEEGSMGDCCARLFAVQCHADGGDAANLLPRALQRVVEEGVDARTAAEEAEQVQVAEAPPAPLAEGAIPDASGWKPKLRFNRAARTQVTRQRAGRGAVPAEAEEEGDEGTFISISLGGGSATPPSTSIAVQEVNDPALRAAAEAAEAAAAAAAAAAADTASESDEGPSAHDAAVDGVPLTAQDAAFLDAAGWRALPSVPPPPSTAPTVPGAGKVSLILPPPPPPA